VSVAPGLKPSPRSSVRATLRLDCVESDEKGSQGCWIEHVGSPFGSGLLSPLPSGGRASESNTCRFGITIGIA
jgi:hypothetical protein